MRPQPDTARIDKVRALLEREAESRRASEAENKGLRVQLWAPAAVAVIGAIATIVAAIVARSK